MNRPRIRVLVVEDSLTVRKRLVDVLGADPELEVVGEAEDGKRAIELCQQLRPDLITLDMMLPVMTGLAATEYIMAYCPTPILIVSSSTNRGELFRTFEALAAGAVDVLDKPDGTAPDDAWERRLIATVKLVARIKVITHPRARLAGLGRAAAPTLPAPAEPVAAARRAPRAVAIGVSTGGPAALVRILHGLPADFTLPVLIVMHIGQPFGVALADWLDGQTPRPVAFARSGELIPTDGRVVLAPPERHLVVQGGRLVLLDEAPRHSCRPSVDVFFDSVARELGAGVIACLLTGMGRDGADGLLAVRRAGGRTIAQDEATSVVFGMPREAILLGAAEQVLPLEQVAPTLVGLARRRP